MINNRVKIERKTGIGRPGNRSNFRKKQTVILIPIDITKIITNAVIKLDKIKATEGIIE